MRAFMIRSTMQDYQLTIGAIMRHGARVYPGSQCVTWTGSGTRRVSYAEVAANAGRLAAALARLGIGPNDPVATFCWNNAEHLEAYFGVPSMGAVLHTLNIRLPGAQVAQIVNHAGDRIVIVDDSLVPLLARIAGELPTVEAFIVNGTAPSSDASASALEGRVPVLRYHELLAAEQPDYTWPELDERDAALMCYTSGTTGDPKGVVYSHRSTYLHAMAVMAASVKGITEADRALAIVPMFHANAWGLPEMSPVGGLAIPPAGPGENIEDGSAEDLDWRTRAGRVIHGVEMRIIGKDDEDLPAGGVSEGEIEVRGPWVTGSYHHDPAPEKFRDGWLRTGDVGTLDERGFFTITDRIKDVIKSGGEWISSVDLENELMAHPAVQEAAVIGIPDKRWGERPLACVVVGAGAKADAAELDQFLGAKVARWQVPENWAFVAEIPKTAVGKFDKKVLRAEQAADELTIERLTG